MHTKYCVIYTLVNEGMKEEALFVCNSIDEEAEKCVLQRVKLSLDLSDARDNLPYRKGCVVIGFRSEFLIHWYRIENDHFRLDLHSWWNAFHQRFIADRTL